MDTASLAEVSEEQQLDEDGGIYSDSRSGSLTSEELEEILDNPGEPLEDFDFSGGDPWA